MTKIDMSPEAVIGRLRRVDELRDLCRVLAGPRLKVPHEIDSTPARIKEQAEAYELKSAENRG